MNWLLLRGLARQSAHWRYFPALMINSGLAEDVMALDNPGVGEFSNERPPVSIRGMTDLTRQRWLSRADMSRSWGVLGISLGGMMALDWMNRYPGDFKTGIIINSSTAGLTSPWQRMQLDTMRHLPALFLTRDGLERERLLLGLTSRLDSTELARIALDYAAIDRKHPVSRINVIGQLSAALRFRAPSLIEAPLLFLASKHDNLVDPLNSERLAEKYHAPLIHHPWAGHDLPLDDPLWIIDRMKGLAATPARPADAPCLSAGVAVRGSHRPDEAP